jgi:tetratricopeptide (TPR) repeat protein
MTKVGFLKFIMLFLLIPAAYGQKVKYKDIFALLSTKQYEQAEPFLKKYLKENDDNPNAYLFMAIIFQEKSSKTDILKQTPVMLSCMDSAIYYYDKANKTIDDREVRKNKDYYQSYNRRDLRTGEFGVKLSDIQFDIQKKIEGLREKIDQVKMVKHYFSLADTLYKKSNILFGDIQRAYPSERQLYLRADEGSIKNLQALSARFDSCSRAFQSYKGSANTLGKTGYNQTFEPREIADYSKEGRDMANLFEDQPKVWDYKKFADKSLDVIQKEILPMREHLISYDIEINKLRDRLNTDSVSVRNDLTKLIDKLLYDQLRKFDPDPLPMEVFSLKTADLEYRSALIENLPMNDTADVHLKLGMINTEMRLLNKLDSIASKLSLENLDQKSDDYQHFITNTYNNSTVLKSYVKALKEYAEREKRRKTDDLSIRLKALDWIIDGTDSIPLKTQVDRSRFKPLFTENEKYTLGLHVHDSTTTNGYFYTITTTRKPEVKVQFPVDKSSFKERKLRSAKSLSYAEGSGQLYFVLVYSEQGNKDKYPATLAKIYRTDGLAWSNNIALTFIPKELVLKPETGELTIKNDTQQTVIDKNGKVVK